MRGLTIEHVSAGRVRALADDLEAVYAAAFAPPPHNDTAADARSWVLLLPQHARISGFRLAVARLDGAIVGFIYGHDNHLDSPWWSQVGRGLAPHVRSTIESASSYTIPEFAVHPDVQGRGIGAKLYDAFFASGRHERTLLTVLTEADARQFYERRGWRGVGDGAWSEGRTYLLLALEPGH